MSLMGGGSDRTLQMDSGSGTSLMCSSSDLSLMDNSGDHTSLTDVLSGLPTATPVAVVSGSNDASNVVEHRSEILSALQQRETSSTVKDGEGNASTVHVSKPNAVKNGELRYISKYLVQFVPDAKPQKKDEVVRVSGARVLTSDKCAAILKEREEKKNKEKEEKERRKLMREQKKKEREEEQRKKKAAAAEKRAAAAEKRAAAAERKATIEAEKKAAAEAKKAAAEAKKAAAEARKAAAVGKQAEKVVGDELSRKRQAASYTTRAKQSRLDSDANVPTSSHTVNTTAIVDGNENECCVCFSAYQEDEEDDDWVQCGCSRWLHEGCITDVIIDVSGKELFCPYCSL